ncbi:MAG: alpha/beta hydrolase [Rubripirellula sp.]
MPTHFVRKNPSVQRLALLLLTASFLLTGCAKQPAEMAAAPENSGVESDWIETPPTADSIAPGQAEPAAGQAEPAAVQTAPIAPIQTQTAQTQAIRIDGAIARKQNATRSRSAAKSSRQVAPAAAPMQANGVESFQAPTFDAPAFESHAGGFQSQPMAMEAPELSIPPAAGTERARLLSQFPAGTSLGDSGFATVQVFYATDRLRDAVPLSAYEVTGQKRLFAIVSGIAVVLLVVGGLFWFVGRNRIGGMTAMAGFAAGVLAAVLVTMGQANIEKHGVTYSGDRGTLVRGICEVTVPDSHERGMVERPSLLRFEFKEDQQEHIVLTSAVELSADDFQKRLSDTVLQSRDGDLLVFVHGYNVDFQSAVQRTAQIAVDLPFEGVPVCYSWPSQGTLVGYPIDETNAAWTTAHFKQFLLELVEESGARSINVVAHSMGNRPMTAAMEQIRWQRDEELDTPFDRIVLAAPDVDADRFRRDLAPSLLQVADQVTLYASSDDQALIVSKQVHGYPRAGESGINVVVVPGIETIDVSGIDLSLLGHSYYGDNESMLRDLYEVVRARLPAPRRAMLIPLQQGELLYWQLAQRQVMQR